LGDDETMTWMQSWAIAGFSLLRTLEKDLTSSMANGPDESGKNEK
jgi:hypothetical protein